MSAVNSNIQIGKKDAAFFAANPALVLLDGQLIYNEDTGDLFIGDGVTPLIGLTPINVGSGFTPSGTNLEYIAGDGSYIIFPTDNAAFTNGAGYLSSGDINVTVQPYDGDTTILGNAVVGDSVVVTDSNGLLDSVTLAANQSIRRNASNTAFESYSPLLASDVWQNPINSIRVVGRYFGALGASTVGSSAGFAPNARRAYPYFIPYTHSVDRIRCFCSAGAAGAKMRLGIYLDNGSFSPGNLLLDAGEVDLSTNGNKEIVINQQLTQSMRLVWVTYNLTGNPTMVWWNTSTLTLFGSDNTFIQTQLQVVRSATDTYGAGYVLPSSFGSVAGYETLQTNFIAVDLRVSSLT